VNKGAKLIPGSHEADRERNGDKRNLNYEGTVAVLKGRQCVDLELTSFKKLHKERGGGSR